MHIDILTLFPEMFPGYLNESILKRAQEMGQLAIGLHNIRDYAEGKHRVTDEPPYGGGGGMVLKPEPVFAAVEAVLEKQKAEGRGQNHPSDLRSPTLSPRHRVILLSPQGRP
ncbi:MAG: tRNA (guanine(37)-N(1))-methyltransferase, partial [Anaerolineae bacterium]